MGHKYRDFEKSKPELIERWQWNQVLNLLKRAERTKFYGSQLKSSGIKVNALKSFKDLKKLPFTTEDDLRNKARDFLYFPLNKVWRIFATSGTTGKPKLIFREPIDKNSEIISVWRHLFKRAGYWPRIAAVMRPAGGLGASGPVTSKVMEHLEIPCFTLSPEAETGRNTAAILEIKPDAWIISPSFAVLMVHSIKKQRINPKSLGVKLVVSTGEALHPNERSYLMRELGADVINTYGAADPSVWIASECSRHRGLHIFPYTSYLEFIGPFGQAGKKYELIVSPFANHAMPLVRYRLGDLVELETGKCACGRTLPRIMSVIRKESPVVIAADGKKYKLKARQTLNQIALINPAISSFFNFRYLKSKKRIILKIEAYPENIKSRPTADLAEKIKAKFFELQPEIGKLESKQKIRLDVEVVPVGTLARRAAKIVDQISCE